MAHYQWNELFPPHILERGRSYYLEGKVVGMTRNGPTTDATVQGTDRYAVSVTLEKKTGRIKHYFCDCPYGEDGTPCKHLAALLFAIEADDISDLNCAQNTVNGTAKGSVCDAVEQLTQAQMRKLLVQFAENDPYIKEKIMLAATKKLPQTQKEQWQADLLELTDEAADRYGFIDYENAYDYTCSLQNYLNDRIPDLLRCGLIMDAFDLVCLVFQTGIEQEMEDSDGGSSMLASCCAEAWNEIIGMASQAEQQEMCHWFTSQYSQLEYGQMFIDLYLHDFPWMPEVASELLLFLDDQIQKCIDDTKKRYRLDTLVTHKLRWMKQLGFAQEEIAAYIAKYHQLPSVREIEIAQAQQNHDWDTVLILLEESKSLDADKLGLVCRYSGQMIEIYEKKQDVPSLKKELLYQLFHFQQDDLTYVKKLRAIVSGAEWETIRAELLKAPTMLYQIYALLAEEKMYAALMTRIEKNLDIYALEKYETIVKKEYPERCVEVYRSWLQQSMLQASDRKAYRTVIQSLKKLKKYPDGSTVAQELANTWKQDFKRRTSMLDELQKAGF